MLNSTIVAVCFALELNFLKASVSSHPQIAILLGEFKHAEVERVEAGKRDELEFVAHQSKFRLEFRNRVLVELLLPVERGRAVVGEQLARILRMDGMSKASGFFEV